MPTTPRVRHTFQTDDGQTWEFFTPPDLSREALIAEAERQFEGGTAQPVPGLLTRLSRAAQEPFGFAPGGEGTQAGGEALGQLLRQPTVQGAAPAIAGGLAGRALGALPILAGPTAGLSIPLGGAIGGATGEAGRQVVAGQFDPLGIAMAGGTEMLGPALGALGRTAPGFAAGAQRFASSIVRVPERVAQIIAPRAGEAERLFQAAAQEVGSLKVSTRPLEAVVAKLRRENVQPLIPPEVRKLVEPVAGVTTIQVDFTVYRNSMRRLGERIRTQEARGNQVALGEFKQLYHAAWDGLENLARGSKTLKEATQVFKEEEAARWLGDYFKAATSIKQQVGLKEINYAAVATKLTHDIDELARFVPRERVDRAIDLLSEFAKLPPITPPTLGILGGTAGRVANTASGIDALGRMLMSSAGQAVVAEMIRQKQPIQQIINTAAQLGRVQLFPSARP